MRSSSFPETFPRELAGPPFLKDDVPKAAGCNFKSFSGAFWCGRDFAWPVHGARSKVRRVRGWVGAAGLRAREIRPSLIRRFFASFWPPIVVSPIAPRVGRKPKSVPFALQRLQRLPHRGTAHVKNWLGQICFHQPVLPGFVEPIQNCCSNLV